MKLLKRFETYLVSVEKVVVTLAVAVLLIVGLLQIVVRLLGIRSLGTDEVAALMMVTLIFIGAALVTATGDSIAVEVIDIVPSARARWIIGIFALATTIAAGSIFAYYAFEFASVAFASGEKSIQLQIPKALPTSVMAVGGALLTLHAIVRLVIHLSHWRDPETKALDESRAGSVEEGI